MYMDHALGTIALFIMANNAYIAIATYVYI